MAFWNQRGRRKGQSSQSYVAGSSGGDHSLRIIRKGPAMRVIFFYPGEEGTYVDHADVTLYENGIVHIASNQEESTTHLQNCEILWTFEVEADDRTTNKVRLLKARDSDSSDQSPKPIKPGKGPTKNP